MSSGRNISLEDVQEDKMLTTSIVGEIVSHVGAQVLVPVLPTNVVDIPVCRTSKQSKPQSGDPIKGYLVHESNQVLILDEEPTTYKAPMANSNSEKFLGATNS